jgi:hypothetical protein
LLVAGGQVGDAMAVPGLESIYDGEFLFDARVKQARTEALIRLNLSCQYSTPSMLAMQLLHLTITTLSVQVWADGKGDAAIE